MPGLTSVNLQKKCKNFSSIRELGEFTKQIDDWLNENCQFGTYFANRFMRFNFQNESDAIAFKLIFG